MTSSSAVQDDRHPRAQAPGITRGAPGPAAQHPRDDRLSIGNRVAGRGGGSTRASPSLATQTLVHHPWCRDDSDVFTFDDGTLLLVRCRDCRAELVRHTPPRKPEPEGARP